MATLAVAVSVLTAVAAVTSWRAGWGQGREVTVAVGRAVIQLVAVGAVIATVFATPALAPLYLGVMLSVASWTSSRRLPRTAGVLRAVALAIGAGAAVTGLVVLVSGALPLSTRSFVPFLAQIIGGAMTATTLTGSRFADEVRTRWDVVEGWLALGASPRQAVAELGRLAASRALAPAIDQTRSVGLVVLPGAYVGLLLGGATPLEAGRVQLLVLVGLLAAETVSALVVVTLLSEPLSKMVPDVPGRRGRR